MKKIQTRRKFIKNSSKTLATIIGLVTFVKYLSFSQTANERKTNSPFQNENRIKILVAYEGQFGSTAEVAKYVSKILLKDNREIEIKRIDEINNLSSYHKVIIGSAIQYDNWMPKAREFVLANKKTLAKIEVAFFFTCLVLSKKTEKAELQAIGYAEKLKALAPEVNPTSIGRFAGVLDYTKMSLAQRTLAKGLFAILRVKKGDYRDWKKIENWTEQLAF